MEGTEESSSQYKERFVDYMDGLNSSVAGLLVHFEPSLTDCALLEKGLDVDKFPAPNK